MSLDRNQVLSALRTVQDPELFKDIVTLNMVKDVRIDGTAVEVNVELTTPTCPFKDVIERDVTNALKKIGATAVRVLLGANASTPQQPERKNILPQVRNVVAVGAGKGGVGKSTIAVNLAVGLARQGARVGLMDGDIYGPSTPTMLGIKGKQVMVRGPRIIPFNVHGIHAITIGALVEQDKPLIWRGPMAHGAFKQLFCDNTEWPELDYLIVDLPPGTGDVPLTLCQLLPLAGAVVVATPQQVALDDALRAVRMFQQLQTPVLGMIENMSVLHNPDGSTLDIFGHGGAQSAATQWDLPFLGSLALWPALRINSDAGTPLANYADNTPLAQELQAIVESLTEQVSIGNARGVGPELNIH